MSPATEAPARRDGVRLLVLEGARAGAMAPTDAHMDELPSFLRRSDVLVVNDAAALPASIHGLTARGEPIELRLIGPLDAPSARAVLFGAGDFHQKTEHRPAPPLLVPGDAITCAGLSATVLAVSSLSPRLLDLRFDRQGAALLSALYRAGRPVQYAYHLRALPLYEFQTAYGARPWSSEMPSAGRPLSFELLLALRERGVQVVALTHAAGLSSTGDALLDAALPLPERFEIPAETARAVNTARSRGARVIAVGTSVVRALEGSAAQHGGVVTAGAGETDLRIDLDFAPRVVDGLLTGVHAPGESHYLLLGAFASRPALSRAVAHAERRGYLTHEFGDSMLLLSA